ncbi:MAG TPA: metallophosphoesterase [Polyangiales bacterium]|nr:metallophosphoesterase [Polyangiales bacterium]
MRALLLVLFLPGCFLPAEKRARLDRSVGEAEAGGITLEVAEGRAGIRSFDGLRAELWAQAPSLSISVRSDAPRPLVLDVLNCMPGTLLRVDAEAPRAPTPVAGRAASCHFELAVSDSQLELAPAAADTEYAFAVLSDVQDAIGRVQDIYRRMNADPELQFVVSTGDLVETGTRSQLVHFQDELAGLNIPLFSTVGNHEMGAPPSHWHSLFGPFNVNFVHRGVTFSLVDSGNATIDPSMYGRLDDWLDAAEDGTHIVLTHVPPLDPAGLRGGAFRSRKEAAKLVQKLGRGRVDALFLGHIHSYYSFSVADVPTYISGGGGAIQERFDGIERHYLKVRASARGIEDVAIVRVD